MNVEVDTDLAVTNAGIVMRNGYENIKQCISLSCRCRWCLL